MNIFIPTMGRKDQWTLMALPLSWRKKTTILCPANDVAIPVAKKLGANVLIQGSQYKGISGARQQIIDVSDGPVLMMDDDLKFSYRHDKNDTKLTQSTATQVDAALTKAWFLLTKYAHGSISTREGNNREPSSTTFIGRSLRVLGYNATTLKRLGIKFRLRVMEDFDVSLQLLRAGHKNFIIWDHAQDQKVGSGAPGGCSSYRTPAVQKEAAETLAKLHPGFVKVVEKETKTGWKEFGGKRTDVIIYWKKAYESHQPTEATHEARQVKFVIR